MGELNSNVVNPTLSIGHEIAFREPVSDVFCALVRHRDQRPASRRDANRQAPFRRQDLLIDIESMKKDWRLIGEKKP
jgi:hypothetical protein